MSAIGGGYGRLERGWAMEKTGSVAGRRRVKRSGSSAGECEIGREQRLLYQELMTLIGLLAGLRDKTSLDWWRSGDDEHDGLDALFRDVEKAIGLLRPLTRQSGLPAGADELDCVRQMVRTCRRLRRDPPPTRATEALMLQCIRSTVWSEDGENVWCWRDQAPDREGSGGRLVQAGILGAMIGARLAQGLAIVRNELFERAVSKLVSAFPSSPCRDAFLLEACLSRCGSNALSLDYWADFGCRTGMPGRLTKTLQAAVRHLAGRPSDPIVLAGFVGLVLGEWRESPARPVETYVGPMWKRPGSLACARRLGRLYRRLTGSLHLRPPVAKQLLRQISTRWSNPDEIETVLLCLETAIEYSGVCFLSGDTKGVDAMLCPERAATNGDLLRRLVAIATVYAECADRASSSSPSRSDVYRHLEAARETVELAGEVAIAPDGLAAIPAFANVFGVLLRRAIDLYDMAGKGLLTELASGNLSAYEEYLGVLSEWRKRMHDVLDPSATTWMARLARYTTDHLAALRAERRLDVKLSAWTGWLHRLDRPADPINTHELHNVIHQTLLRAVAESHPLSVDGFAEKVQRLVNSFCVNKSEVTDVTTEGVSVDLNICVHKSLMVLRTSHCEWRFYEAPGAQGKNCGRLVSIRLWIEQHVRRRMGLTVSFEHQSSAGDVLLVIRIRRPDGDRLKMHEIRETLLMVMTVFESHSEYSGIHLREVQPLPDLLEHSPLFRRVLPWLMQYREALDYSMCRGEIERNVLRFAFPVMLRHRKIMVQLDEVAEKGYPVFRQRVESLSGRLKHNWRARQMVELLLIAKFPQRSLQDWLAGRIQGVSEAFARHLLARRDVRKLLGKVLTKRNCLPVRKKAVRRELQSMMACGAPSGEKAGESGW